MKRLVFLFTAALMGFASSVIWAQPKLTSITFLNGINGQPIRCTGGGNVAVQLLFDRAMRFSVKPTIKYGLKGGAFNLNIPSTGNWQDTTLFQVVFNINANVPAGPDGEYSFLVFGARDSANNVAMDSTYSDSLNATLLIYRNGNLVSNKDTLNFGVVTFGQSKLDSVLITNAGCANVTINSATVLSPANFTLLNELNGVLQKDSGNFTKHACGSFTLSMRSQTQSTLCFRVAARDRAWHSYRPALLISIRSALATPPAGHCW
jgi:hypothetical protein